MSKALKAAIEANDPEAVRVALKTVKDINRKLSGAKTPLLHACEKGADQVLEVLFQGGAIAEKRNTFPGDTPFAIAAKHRQGQVLKRLLELEQASPEAVKHALENAAMDGEEATLDLVLQTVKPAITIELFNIASAPKNAPAMLRLLVKHGGDVNVRSAASGQKGITPLHGAASGGDVPVMRTLVDCGADVNVRDDLGRTPLMLLAEQLEWRERQDSETGAMSALRTLLDLGADASLLDNFGNDAITYCELAYARQATKATARFLEVLRDAGAPGSGPTGQLFAALRNRDLDAVCRAIEAGADVNRITPPPGGATPLMWADSEEMIDALLSAGANPNQPGLHGTPLINAAGDGNMPIVQRLLAAGADIHAVEVSGEFVQNAYQAAEMNGKFEMVDYLKSLGAGKPKLARAPLQPGVGSWNDFSELLVKTSVERAAQALAEMVKGNIQLAVYGQTLRPGKRAFVVARPKGMDWCNVFQIAPSRNRFEDPKVTETFAAELARAAAAPVLSIEYSDTSDAASILRIEADGTKARDEGWDYASLQEMVNALGDEAPARAKKQLAHTDEDAPSSCERVVSLAEEEKFVVAAFGLACEPGRPLDVE
ncbi:MAG TPA: ankyrin repeat domain-containing protein, partial [Clostridia bacterium]|nr:ankyrin repeat domain-containing protein [Clostridia bacterium]